MRHGSRAGAGKRKGRAQEARPHAVALQASARQAAEWASAGRGKGK